MANTAQLRKMIAEILETADLNSITAKKVRQELEAKLDEDLTSKKKEIDNMVLEILQEKQNGDGKGSKRKTKDDSEEESEDEPEPPKKKKGKKASSDDDSEEETKKKKPAAKRGGTGYTKLCKLSPELSKIMGEENMARHEVVKKMWSIIKEKQLYDPKNKQFAICDADLLAVFGVKRFRTFGMMKYLKHHFLD